MPSVVDGFKSRFDFQSFPLATNGHVQITCGSTVMSQLQEWQTRTWEDVHWEGLVYCGKYAVCISFDSNHLEAFAQLGFCFSSLAHSIIECLPMVSLLDLGFLPRLCVCFDSGYMTRFPTFFGLRVHLNLVALRAEKYQCNAFPTFDCWWFSHWKLWNFHLCS